MKPHLSPATPIASCLLSAVQGLDRITLGVGHAVRWLTLAIPLVCFGYAVVRKLFAWGHNGFSELQWYLFAFVYLLASGYTLLRREHIRVDVFWRRFGTRTRCTIDLLLLIPLMAVCLYMAIGYWDFWLVSLHQREMPEDVVVGLERWPIKLALFLGFGLLGLQCASETLKRIAVLRHWLPATAIYPLDGVSDPSSASGA